MHPSETSASPLAIEATPDVLTVEEAAAVLRCSRATVYRRIDDGGVGGWFVLGDEIRFSRAALLAWVEEQARRPSRRRSRKGRGR